jgi:polyhydroxybutyrate depolymerase
MRQLTPLVAALLLFVACTGGDGGDPPDASGTAVLSPAPQAGCEPSRPAPPGTSRQSLTIDDVARAYGLYVPTTYDGRTAAPLVVVFHGVGQTADDIAEYTGFNDLANEQGLVVAYPEAVPDSRWNAAQTLDAADDVGFASGLLDALETQLCIDEQTIFVVGYSDGGGMAQRLTCVEPERIRALGTVAATYVGCRAPVPWVGFHGMDDMLAPFEAGDIAAQLGGGASLPARRVLSDWSRELGCDALGVISRPADNVELTTFPQCVLGEGEAQLYAIIGGGHTWPGAADRPGAGATSQEIDGTLTLWEFFEAHSALAATPPVEDNVED